jgi:O-antigen/teichoic acid export membrane protein
MADNKRIAKNTIFLYFRMMVTMLISLYTSRVVLQILGVDDYGIYQAVGGIVGFLSFVNNALSTGSSRFLTYGIGEGDPQKLRNIFSTTLTAHICLAIIIVIVAETAGWWFLHNKMVIAADRMNAAEFVFHISILTAFFSLTQVPYGACIIAHEKMSIYAYTSIVDAVLKLAIVYLLTIGHLDRLKLYAILLCVVQIGMIVFYMIYCVKKFDEARFKLFIDKNIFKEIESFSGWSLFATGSIALNNQGILMLLNMFFAPAVVTARSISLQVNNTINQFVTNFQIAANPQIVKLYAAKDYDGSKQLLLQTTKFSYYLMLILCLPVCFCAQELLNIWLVEVPEYTVIFVQLIIIQSLFSVFDTSFYRALYAKGQLRENALISPTLGFLCFPIVYLMFKNGFSPVALSWAGLVTTAILGLIVKPILVIKIVDYTWKDIFSVFVPCMKVTLISLPLPLLFNHFVIIDNIWIYTVSMAIICMVSVGAATWFWGMTPTMKEKLLAEVRKRVKYNRQQ